VSTWPSSAGWEARLVLQRAVDEEVAAFLGRARYERAPMATGSRNGTRPKPIQTAEGEISIAMILAVRSYG
jgi:transposase-like protein